MRRARKRRQHGGGIATPHGFCQPEAQLVRRPRCAFALSGAAVDSPWGVDISRRERAARGQIFLLAACRGPHDGHQILLIARLISAAMRSASVATGTRRPVWAPEPPSLPRVSRASWRRLPCALQEAPPSRRADDEPAVTRTWPRVWSRRGYIRAPPPHQQHARGWWWLAPTVGFQKPKDMLGQCGTMSDARGSSSGRRRRPLSNVSATGTTSAPGACLRSRLRRGDAPTLPPNLPRYIVAKATGLGRSVANGRRMQL